MPDNSKKSQRMAVSPKRDATQHPVVELFAHLLAAKILRDMGVESQPKSPIQPKHEPPR